MYPVPGKKIWPKNEALTVSAANPKSRSREKTSEKIKVNLHSKGERRYPFTDVLITDGFKKPVQIRLKTNPVIDRFCKIYNDTTKACAPAPQVRRPFCTQESVIYSPLPAPAVPEGCQPAT